MIKPKREAKYFHSKQRPAKSYKVDYDHVHQAMVIHVLDPDGMYPCLWQDPEAGPIKLIRTAIVKYR
jgi:hypothetical protein